MATPAFGPADFGLFGITSFDGRMRALRTVLGPKLATFGRSLAPDLARATGGTVHSHVARHARRTVNPPDDTWVAFASDPRGYKRHPHFKVALSRRTLRFLFEIGPEHGAKADWATAWRRSAARLGPVLGRAGVAWFADEHDDAPRALVTDLGPERLVALADELVLRRDGQLVFGRALPATEAARLSSTRCSETALDTFRTLAPLYRLP